MKKYILIVLLLAIMIASAKYFDNDFVNNLFLDGENKFSKLTVYLPIIIFSLRFISIIIPVILGTYCSVLAGYFYGFENGLILVFFADFISCSTCFLISRKFGRGFIQSFLGSKQMQRVEKISKKYLQDNIFFMTALLMSQFFDFASYAIGLTKVSWSKFIPCLIISILVSDAPFVAGGYSLSKLKEVNLSDILTGDLQIISNSHLILLVGSILVIFLLGFLNNKIVKRFKSS